MRNHISARPELLDDLEAPRFLHEHALCLVIRVAKRHDETSRHAPNELALVVVRTLESPLVYVSAQGLIHRRLALVLLFLMACGQRSLSLGVNTAGESP